MYVLLGILTGALSGMGIGGGTVLIPILSWMGGMDQHSIQGLNLLAFLPSSASAAFSYARQGLLCKSLLFRFSAFALAGAAGGALLAAIVPAQSLRKFFAFFLLAVGLWQWITAEKKHHAEKKK